MNSERFKRLFMMRRAVIGYSLKIPDQSADARGEGQAVVDGPPAPIEVPDAGLQPAPEEDDTKRKRIAERVSKWGKRAKPAGGSGRILVDEAIHSGAHGYLSASVRAFAEDQNVKPARHWRIVNEVPTVLMIGIIVLVIVKPF